MRKMRPGVAVLALMGAVSISACATAQPGGRMGNFSPLMMFDLDRNGEVDEAEFQAAKERRFAQRDADGDDSITRAEFDAANERMRQRMARFGRGRSPGGAGFPGGRDPFERLDGNADGVVSKAEFLENDGQFILLADSNEDGVTTRAEMDELMSQVRNYAGQRN